MATREIEKLVIGENTYIIRDADAVVKDTNGDASVNNLKLELDTTAQAGTTDGDLYAAIVALGWESEVIE